MKLERTVFSPSLSLSLKLARGISAPSRVHATRRKNEIRIVFLSFFSSALSGSALHRIIRSNAIKSRCSLATKRQTSRLICWRATYVHSYIFSKDIKATISAVRPWIRVTGNNSTVLYVLYVRYDWHLSSGHFNKKKGGKKTRIGITVNEDIHLFLSNFFSK